VEFYDIEKRFVEERIIQDKKTLKMNFYVFVGFIGYLSANVILHFYINLPASSYFVMGILSLSSFDILILLLMVKNDIKYNKERLRRINEIQEDINLKCTIERYESSRKKYEDLINNYYEAMKDREEATTCEN